MHLTRQGLCEPAIDPEVCVNCARCLQVCGRYRLDYDELRNGVFGAGTPHPLVGHLIACYRGHATDQALRWQATSGGMVTALLKYCFEAGLIDAAIVTGADPADPTRPRPFVARHVEELTPTCQARYAPSPVNVCLREALEYERIAIVGLPCHFESLRKAEIGHPHLQRKIALRLGLFCSHNVSLLATEFICRYFRVAKARVAGLRYRGQGWPGDIRLTTTDGREFHASPGVFWNPMFMAFVFAAPYCLLCTDQTSELADISFGDAWLPEIMKTEKVGESVIVTRTPVGAQSLKEAAAQGYVHVEEIAPARIAESQRWPLYFKKRLIHSRYEFLAGRRFDIKKEHETVPELTRTERNLSRRAWNVAVQSCRPWVPAWLSRLPFRLVRFCVRYYADRLWQQATAWQYEAQI